MVSPTHQHIPVMRQLGLGVEIEGEDSGTGEEKGMENTGECEVGEYRVDGMWGAK